MLSVVLIRPPAIYKKKSTALGASPPLGLAYIAASLKKTGCDVSVIDCIAEAPRKYTEFSDKGVLIGITSKQLLEKIPSHVDLIGIGCMFTNNWLNDRVLIELIKIHRPNAKIIIGGEHATAAPVLCLEQAPSLDAVVMGEGEETVVDIANCIVQNLAFDNVEGIAFRNESGEIILNPRRSRIRTVDEIEWPAWEYFPLQSYFDNNMSYGVTEERSLPIMASRGCPYTCTFCSSPDMWGTRYRIRTSSDVVDEMQTLNEKYGVINFDFYDLTAIIKREWIIETSKEIVQRGLKITWQIPAGTRSEAIDYEVAQWLYKSGCRNITYAPESGSPRILKLIHKKVNLENMLASIAATHKTGMNIKLNFIIGIPGETHTDIWQTLWFLIKASWYGANEAGPSAFSPYPGSALFNDLEKQGKINMKDDSYFWDIILKDGLFSTIVYNDRMNKYTCLVYQLMYVLVFFSSNYLFRPIRLLKSIKNIAMRKYESRLEMTIIETFRRRLIKVEKVERLLPPLVS